MNSALSVAIAIAVSPWSHQYYDASEDTYVS